jgi:hypothetical protein
MPLTRIDPTDFVFNNDAISTSCWRDANGNPVGNTSSTPSFSSEIVNGVINCYIGNPANSQFSIATANKNGTDQQKAVYGAIRNIVFGDKNAVFRFGGSEFSSFKVISISKNCLKSSLLPGSLNLLNGLTDDSNMSPPTILNCGRVYNLIEGDTLPGGGFSYGYGNNVQGIRGMFLPDVGLIITIDVSSAPSVFVLRNLNPTPTNHVFIRARNNQYNYSMNPSFISGSSGLVINQDWYSNPQTYITTVGLYNDNNELMATAKLPHPYNKNFQNELLMQVGLNF